MFTGIISDIGRIVALEPMAKGVRLDIQSHFDPETILLGASIASDGVCLTVTQITPNDEGCLYQVDLSEETLKRTTAHSWGIGRLLNLERALKVGDELGGHWVSGHVDGIAQIESTIKEADFTRFEVSIPKDLMPFVAQKGSITLDGISLTVNELKSSQIGLTLVPHTLAHTTWGAKQIGDTINVEIDLMARYAARLMKANT